jgi:hypothetical protein
MQNDNAKPLSHYIAFVNRVVLLIAVSIDLDLSTLLPGCTPSSRQRNRCYKGCSYDFVVVFKLNLSLDNRQITTTYMIISYRILYA